MFTGIIEAVGTLVNFQQLDSEWQISVDSGKMDLSDVAIGDSIAVNGTCLTVIAFDHKTFQADVSSETMKLTTLGLLGKGAAVNLEKALTPSSRLGGHLVSGHVDGVGELEAIEPDGKSWRLLFKAPDDLARYIATKGSICIDGASLTVNGVEGARFEVNIIPHTQQQTVFKNYKPASKVNLEVDLISRYLERLVLGSEAATGNETAESITRGFLSRHGFDNKAG
ncbi:MAG: riboflavin synthase [Gammaproteobacteria bacterium]|nr:riboflavin synthase [Gammaproteobacteria bacterium]